MFELKYRSYNFAFTTLKRELIRNKFKKLIASVNVLFLEVEHNYVAPLKKWGYENIQRSFGINESDGGRIIIENFGLK